MTVKWCGLEGLSRRVWSGETDQETKGVVRRL